MLWQHNKSLPAICQGYFQHRSELLGWIFKCRFLHCSCKTFIRLPQEAGTYCCSYVLHMSKASYTQGKCSCALWQPILCNGNNSLPGWRILPCSQKLGKVINGVKREGNLQWDLAGMAACDGCTKLQSSACDVHHWASSCRSLSLLGTKRDDTTRNAAAAALLNVV